MILAERNTSKHHSARPLSDKQGTTHGDSAPYHQWRRARNLIPLTNSSLVCPSVNGTVATPRASAGGSAPIGCGSRIVLTTARLVPPGSTEGPFWSTPASKFCNIG